MANNSRVNITLGFNADTDQAKRQINDLVNQLRSIQSTPTTLVDDTSLRKASAAAAELQGHLQKAVDVNTGKLDLSRFSASLKQSGKQLSDYRRDLEAIGPVGSQAFLSVAKSIATAETPLLRTNKRLNEFMTTMKNTAKWQISSSIMHGFMGAVQQAYGYSQSLNESLNNIRIVTGYNTEQMAEFASQANKAAKALSTTTTDYTNASLIYFQQGLSDEEVQKRTDITVKMANVARDSVDNVSNQLTAIWNNFYEEGGKSLEYYADVMTALGAKTASSTEEIAGGLEKFAAIGDTIGLSYEYAASALATITSNTRQSEEVVGTALKTIFARIQGLNLGETLEDGVSMNKYSEALAKVGVSIFESNGELKAMDNILDELAARWSTLNNTQQTALAQTVAGVRQYTQLIALMENWNNGDEDSFMANINTSRNAEGALNEQADIYADSWEAARDRVKAAQEDVYDSLINDKFFIQLDNTLTPILGFTADLIDGFGGLEGIILAIGGIITQVFAKEAPKVISNLTSNLSVLFGKANKEAVKMQQQVIGIFDEKISSNQNISKNYAYEAQIKSMKVVAQMQASLNANAKELSEEERVAYELKIQQAQATADLIEEEGRLIQQRQQDLNHQEGHINNVLRNTRIDTLSDEDRSILNNPLAQGIYKNGLTENASPELAEEETRLLNQYTAALKRSQAATQQWQLAQEAAGKTKDLSITLGRLQQAFNSLNMQTSNWSKNGKGDIDAYKKSLRGIITGFQEIKNALPEDIQDEFNVNFQPLVEALNDPKIKLEELEKKAEAVIQKLQFLQSGVAVENPDQEEDNKQGRYSEDYTGIEDTIREHITAEIDTVRQFSGEAANSLDNMSESAIETGVHLEANNQTMNSFSENIELSNGHTVKLSESFTKLGGTVMVAASGMQSMMSSISILADEDADIGAKIGAVVTAISTLAMVTGSALDTGKNFEQFFKQLKNGASVAASSAGAAASSIAATGAASSAATPAAAGLSTALGPIAIILAAIAAAGIIAVGVYQSIAEHQKKVAENAAEVAEKQREEAKEREKSLRSNQDHIKILKETLDNWEDQSQTLDQVSDNADEVKNAIDALTEAYEIQGGVLARLSGRYEDYQAVLQKAYEANKKEIQKTIETKQKAIDATEEELARKMVVEYGNAVSDGENGQLQITIDGGFGEKYYPIYDTIDEVFQKMGISSGAIRDGRNSLTTVGNYDFTIDSNNAAEYVKAYDAMAESMRRIEILEGGYESASKNKAYKDMEKLTGIMEEQVEILRAAISEVETLELELGKIGGVDFNLTDELFNVKSLEQYHAWVEKLKQALQKVGKSDQFDEILSSYGNVTLNPLIKELQLLDSGLDEATEKVKNLKKNQIISVFKAAGIDDTSEQVNIIGSINWDTINNEADLIDQINHLQTIADREKVKLSIEATDEAIDNLISGNATTEDYNTIINHFMSEGLLNKDEVLALLSASEDEQIAIILQKRQELNNKLFDLNKKLLDSTSKESLEQQRQDAKDKIVIEEQALENTKNKIKQLESNTLLTRGQQVVLKNLKQEAIDTENRIKGLENGIKQLDQTEIQIKLEEQEALRKIERIREEIAKEIKITLEFDIEKLLIDDNTKKSYYEAIISKNQAILNDPTRSSEHASAMTALTAAQTALNTINQQIISTYKGTGRDQAGENVISKKTEATTNNWLGDISFAFADEKGNPITIDNVEEIRKAQAIAISGIDKTSETGLETIRKINEEADELVKAIEKYNDGIIAGINEETKSINTENEKRKNVVEDIDISDKYDDLGPVENEIDTLQKKLENLTKEGSTASLEEIQATYELLNAALNKKKELIDNQVSSLKSELMAAGVSFDGSAIINADAFEAKLQDRITSKTNEINDRKAKGLDTTQLEKERNNLVEVIDKMNTYNDLLEKQQNIWKEISEYKGNDYSLKNSVREHDIYQAINKDLEKLEDKLSDIERLKKKSYGQNYIDALKKENEALEEQKKALAKKREIAQKQLIIDKQDLEMTISKYKQELQISAQFDAETGQLLNYGQILDVIYSNLRTAQEQWLQAAKSGQKEMQDQLDITIQKWQNMLNVISSAYESYATTDLQIDQINNSIQEAIDRQMSNNSEAWSYAIEVKLQIDENELEILDKKLSILGDGFYSMAEAAGLMMDKVNKISSQGTFDDIAGSWQELQSLFSSNSITQKDFVDNAQMLFDQVSGNIDKLMDIDKEMMEYYSKAIDAANEEMDYYTNQLEHFSSVLDHYKNIVEIVNGEMDYERTGAILEGRVKTLQNEMKVSEDYYAMLKREQEAAKAALASATGEKERELLEANLKAITEAVIEAEEEMLSKTEEWAEATKELMENTMAKAARAMEMAFTDGLTFDFLSDSMDRLSTYQDEYLTKTNQMYETEKLMRTAQQAADKTQNKVAKEKLQGYIKETTELQNKNKLSKLELEIQQAKYDILVAEIALEEAQNAKSTVRLQRDSEGNFGYVYTADSDKISQAEQDLADASNRLHNIRLDAFNENGQKLIDLAQQQADALIELEERRVNGEFKTNEDYEKAKAQLLKEYTDLFTAYSHNYTVAMQDDASIQQEAWVSSYQNIIDKTNIWSEDSNAAFDAVGQGIGEWKDIVDGYLGECETAYGDWRAVVETESQVVQQLLTDTQGAVDEVTKASDELATEVTTVVIPGIEAELSAVREITTAYGTMRDEVYTLADAYVKLLGDIEAAISAAAGMSDITIPEVKFDDGGLPPNVTDNGGGGGDSGGSGGNDAASQQLAARASEIIMKVHYGEIKDPHKNGWLDDAAKDSANYTAEEINLALKAFNDSDPEKGYNYVLDKALQLVGSYDTGGYTGSWGPEGRLAFLHEKELILKPEDTQNFLAATGLLRDIAGMIDLQAMYSQMTSPTASTVSSGGGFFEQAVHIEASFPAVQDRNEIQEAFNNLLNTASQYANRK